MTLLSAQARLEWPDAVRQLAPVFVHMREHGAEVEAGPDAATIRLGERRGEFRQQDRFVEIRIEAPDLGGLHLMKVAIASHIVGYLKNLGVDLVWSGDGADLRTPPNFRRLRVVSSEAVGPHLRRIHFEGEDLSLFATSANLHCKLLLPQPGVKDPEWPTLSESGLPIFPQGEKRLDVRTYTIRLIDAERGVMAIDFVLHGDAGPGSSWAAAAKPGDLIGAHGPGGHGVETADWYLLAGDETALPAIFRILENLPASARGVALIEVAGPDGELPVSFKADIRLRWLHRDGSAPGSTTLLPDAIRTMEFPAEGAIFAWVGAEFDAFKTIRGHLRRERRLKRDQHLVVSYWRRGRTETEVSREQEHDH